MGDFFTGLQFLTRINIVRQDSVSAESFGRSVRYFPLIGAIIGAFLAGLSHFLGGRLPIHTLAAIIILAEIVVTGGLHLDGLMDTADGVFSYRSRERILEIMKDSRVGANGVIVCAALLLLKWSLLLDLLNVAATPALFIMPVLGRFAMVIGITLFPYARPEGIGKAFAQFAGRPAFFVAAVMTVALVLPWGLKALISLVAVTAVTFMAARYFTKVLGGLTGDVYGTITELSEIVVLFVFILVRDWGLLWIK